MATLTFTAYKVQDTGIEMTFYDPDPGPGRPSLYTITATDAEMAPVTSQAQAVALVRQKLRRKLQAEGIATKLDPLIGQSITI